MKKNSLLFSIFLAMHFNSLFSFYAKVFPEPKPNTSPKSADWYASMSASANAHNKKGSTRKKSQSEVLRRREHIRKKLRAVQSAPESLESVVEGLNAWRELNLQKILRDPTTFTAVYASLCKIEKDMHETDELLASAEKNLGRWAINIETNFHEHSKLTHEQLQLEAAQQNIYTQHYTEQLRLLQPKSPKESKKG